MGLCDLFAATKTERLIVMTVLLTGGAGYIGSHTALVLLNARHKVIVADNLCNSSREALLRVEQLTGKTIVFYPIDVTDQTALDVVFSHHAIDAVVHFAGLKAVGESVAHPILYYRNNLCATLTLLEVMSRHKVNTIVFSSSATVYGAERSPLTEEMPTGCTNPYGWTKYMSERILLDAAEANDNLSVVLLRYFNPIGAHESGQIGEDPAGVPNNLMPSITQVAVGRLPFLRIFGNDYPTPDKTGVRDYIHVTDLATGHLAALEFAACKTRREIINLGTGRGTSVLELVRAFEKAAGLEIPVKFFPRRAGDLAEVYADVRKARSLLNWQAEKNIQDMCRDSWRWQSQNPKGYTGVQ
jgi:UDP-glucose 4-epimerase